MDKNVSKDFVEYLHFFRGFAIVCIVGAHAWSFPTFVYGGEQQFAGHIFLYTLTETLFHGSTQYFALISGVLFGHVLKQRTWSAFARSKVLNVVSPYVVISVIFAGLNWFLNSSVDKDPWFSFGFLLETIENIVLGRVQIHFWYMPVLFLLFALTPVLHWCYRQSPRGYLLLSVLPLIFSRTIYPDFLTLHSVLYFLGIYAVGIWCGENLEFVVQQMRRYHASVLVAALLMSAIVAILIFNHYPANQGYSWLQSAVYIQKLSISAVVVVWFERLSISSNKDFLKALWSTLGEYSFAIYFLHVVFVFSLSELVKSYVPGLTLAGLAVVGVFILILGIALSMLTAAAIKKVLGRRSRWIVGA